MQKAIGESDIHSDGCMDKHTDGHIDKHTDGHMDKHTGGHMDKHTDGHMDKPTDGHMSKHTDVFSDRHTPLEKCQKLLADNRKEAGRPDNLDHMSLEQLREEKLSVQKTLIQYESEHGRPVSCTHGQYTVYCILLYSKQKKARK